MEQQEQTSLSGLLPQKNTYAVNGYPATKKRVWDGKKWINRIEFKNSETWNRITK